MTDLSVIPNEPGCYLHKDEDGKVIYVGKAKNLKKRVSSYFNRNITDPKTKALVKSISTTDFIVTGNEVEAFILENNLIKRYQPKYNIDLKDSKSYAYIRLSGDKFPSIGIARKKTGTGEVFGPFVSAKERDYVLSVVKKTFKLRSCRRMSKRGCLRAHIGTCSAPCMKKISADDYSSQVKKASSVLRGNTKEMIKSLEYEMEEKAESLDFENAIQLRDQAAALGHLAERQHISSKKLTDEDVINFSERDGVIYLMLFSVYKGCLAEKQEFIFDDGDEALEEFIIQYYSENEPPFELILPVSTGSTLEDFLSEKKGRKVKVTVPLKGDKKILLDLVLHNVKTVFFGGEIKVSELKKRLHLPENPDVIECFDISHLSGTNTVGSMVQFRYGRPDKRNYRRFRIKTVDKIDDFASIAEVVKRRYSRLKNEGDTYPDLIIIDGGKGQLSAAKGALDEVGVKIPLISVAKKEEEIFVPGFSHPLPLKRTEKASLFIQEIRDEAHRFAITYNRLLKSKEIEEDK
ncbi:excinuclease ABC subunit C [Methanomicrobium sp. W14]|uniref:excinuclease ABC subunit UvrC n=1 Tax=Methanomicrobium sp. W14 TaxID=2817839 RepID=UPI001AEACE25|nr:excinuclease ABC subunit UvrC [Methanomicrobium sp. W14]MBP2132675.1 excinuclease ABC subunit C [Methanomicrobium sp. W14]